MKYYRQCTTELLKEGEGMTIEVAMAFHSFGLAVVVNDGNKVTLKIDEK